MAEPLRNFPLEEKSEEKVTVELEVVPGSALPGTTPAFDEAQARRMIAETATEGSDVSESTAQSAGGTMENISNAVKTGLEAVSERSKEVGEKIAEAADETRDRIQELALEAGRRAQDLRETAIYRARQVRREARQFANERPIQAVLAIGGAAFLIGLILRIWRSNRD
jgi:ElaB/YqjD/DUF883 family membrane-anchored ribosome-binding protein